MSPRKILRIVVSLGIIVLVWMRVGREWLAGSVVLSVILLVVILAEVNGIRKQRDQVPKKPLGL